VPRQAQRSRRRVNRCAAVALGCLAILTPLAFGKGVDLSLRANDRSPSVGQQVTITLKARLDPEMPHDETPGNHSAERFPEGSVR